MPETLDLGEGDDGFLLVVIHVPGQEQPIELTLDVWLTNNRIWRGLQPLDKEATEDEKGVLSERLTENTVNTIIEFGGPKLSHAKAWEIRERVFELAEAVRKKVAPAQGTNTPVTG